MARSSFGVISLSSCCSRSCLLRLAKACMITISQRSKRRREGRDEMIRGGYHTHTVQCPRHGPSASQGDQHGLHQSICARSHAASSTMPRHALLRALSSPTFRGYAPVQHMKRTMLCQGNDSVEYLIASILFRAYLVSPPRELEAIAEEAA